ncbi:MAG: hypothetical protein JOY81_07390, partial [Alphaproteobacteria bacterium]|nr:hypothetical protein [Alphaproteobacteria bacterium]
MASPRRFERTILAAFAAVVLLMLGAGAAWLAMTGELPLHSPRWLYFAYVAAVLLLALATLPRSYLAAVLLALAFIDTIWGLGSYAFDRNHGQDSLLPPKLYEPPRFQWHALL